MSKNIKQLRKRLIGKGVFETDKLITPKEVLINGLSLAPFMAAAIIKHNYDINKKEREQQGGKKIRRKK